MLIVLTLLMGLSLEAALLTLSMDIGEKNERELTAFGSNIVLLPKEEAGASGVDLSLSARSHIPQDGLKGLEGIADFPLEGYAPFLYEMADVGGHQIVITGTAFDKALKINPWWSINGEVPGNGGKGIVLGEEAAKKLNLSVGDSFVLNMDGKPRQLTVTGTLLSGDSGDNQIFMDLDLAQSLAGLSGKVSVVEVSVLAGEGQNLDEVAGSLEEMVPGARARTVKQVAEAGQNLLGKVNLLMGLVTAMIVFISGLTVSASLANAVIERRREIGLMKSLGAEGRGIAAIIIGEALVLSSLAGPLGFVMGLGLAQIIGLSVFDTMVSFHLSVIPVVIISAAVLAVMASLMPVRRALTIEPAVILRGE